MPKNPHPPRGGGSKKPAPASSSNADDTSFIVFSNAKGDPKKGKKVDNAAKDGQDIKGKGKPKDAAGPAEEAPKKPDTRTLIGGASWTGKLPVNLLSEHCQKQKWAKPDYQMNKNQGGLFSSSVVLKATNPKTRETVALPPFRLPDSHVDLALRPTAVEARHFAAAYALFRVSSMKNHHMAMPPTYRDLWKGTFQDLKRADTKDGKAWMYEADPFLTQKEREQAKAVTAKQREDAQKQITKEQSQLGAPGGASGISSGSGGNRMKGWTRVPRIELGKRTRMEAEKLIRRDALWNPHGLQLTPQAQNRIIEEVSGLGFRRSHVEEAAELCKDRDEILEWLLIHVPEDDLPSWSLPEGYVAGISMASGNIKREATIKRLASAGYAAELCEEALDAQGSDESKAAAVLQANLLQKTDWDGNITQDYTNTTLDVKADSMSNAWEEEQTTLAAIYDDRYESPSPGICHIRLEVSLELEKQFVLHVRQPSGPYPFVPPTISVHADLPAYIRLSIIRKALMHAISNLLGTQMLFDLVDWLEQEIPNIIERPGRLTEVSSGLSAADSGAHTRQFHQKESRNWSRKRVNWQPGTDTSLRMLSQWQARQSLPAQQRMLAVRQALPAWKLREAIVRAVECNQVVIISGETGSGKSTQSVQFILDDLIGKKLGEAANIICTQPRRISALGLADRVADERCSIVGEEIGYVIRGESKQKTGITKITFVTTGVLLRRLQASGGSPGNVVAALADVSHVVVDEVHERSLDTDFLLVLLRDILHRRKDLKVILMSATLDADVFEAYFRSVGSVGRVEIQGRTHPVEDFYIDDVIRMTGFNAHRDDELDDEADVQKSMAGALNSVGMRINYDLIAATVRHIDTQLRGQSGGILIFLPGTMEIDRTLQALRQIPNLHALPLHASLLPAEQKRVFPPPPKGKRKVVATTNVAETSITIEDIVAVIDTGRVKETSFDPQNNIVKLGEVWASKAACKQRRGRAGRVRAGNCYKLYTRNAEIKMLERPDPEIRRVPLEQMCLSVRAMGVRDVPGFLAGALTPPDSTAVEGAIDLLTRMSALDGDELTALGRHLSMIPADLRCSKLLIYGATFGCLEATLIIASVLTLRSPFFSPKDKREESRAARASFGKGQGDLISDLRAYEQWSGMRSKGISSRDLRSWCDQNFLSPQTLHEITSNRSQYLSSLKETNFIPPYYSSIDASSQGNHNRYNSNDALLRALIAGAFNPQISRIDLPDKKFAASVSGAVELDPEAKTIKYFNQDNGRVFVHPSSTLFDAQTFPNNAKFMSYFNKMATSKVFIRDLTPFNAYALLLFSGSISLDTLGRGLVVDGWLRLRGWARVGVLVSRLRAMLDEVLARKIDDPALDLGDSDVVDIVRRLVELDGLDR